MYSLTNENPCKIKKNRGNRIRTCDLTVRKQRVKTAWIKAFQNMGNQKVIKKVIRTGVRKIII